MLDHGGYLCLEEHSKSKLVYTASMCKINEIKTCYWLFYVALKNNASGYPATVTAVDIIDTMYVFI